MPREVDRLALLEVDVGAAARQPVAGPGEPRLLAGSSAGAIEFQLLLELVEPRPHLLALLAAGPPVVERRPRQAEKRIETSSPTTTATSPVIWATLVSPWAASTRSGSW